jgi:hypothetical protein
VRGDVAAANGGPVRAYTANAGLFQPVELGFDSDGVQTSQLNSVDSTGVAAGTLTDHTDTYGVVALPGTAFGLPYQRAIIAAP